MMFPHTITIINYVREKGYSKAYYKVLENVLYQDKQGIKTGQQVSNTDNQGYVQIPESVEGYVPPHEYKLLVDKSEHWTLQENDKIVKGSYIGVPEDDINGLRLIDSFENVDYGITLGSHFGVTLV